MKFKLSQRKHIPVLTLDNCDYAFPLWKYGLVKAIEKSGLKLDYLSTAALDEVTKGCYTPPFSLKGKTVLDLGACCGETAWYYLNLGAEKAICVECDSQRIQILEENKKNLGLNIDIVPKPFSREHLHLPYDFIKCDVEGHESIILDYLNEGGVLKPCVLEAHSQQLKEQFEAKGFHMVNQNEKAVAFKTGLFLMANYPT